MHKKRKKMKQRTSLWIFFLIFLPSSETFNNTKCAVANKSVCKKGNLNPFCYQKMSQHCNQKGVDNPEHCHNTLGQEQKNVCAVKMVQGNRCGTIKPRVITSPEEPLVELRLYYHESEVFDPEALVNVTFSNPKREGLDIQYSYLGDHFENKCLNFMLHGNVTNTLMYECRVVIPYGNITINTRLTVQSDSGQWASYLFRIPPASRINPEETCLSDWHTFFYIHEGALGIHKDVPITIQSSPFGQVVYKIVLVQHLDALDGKNHTLHEVDEKYVTMNISNDLRLVYLSPVTSPGNYSVRVQIVSEWCPKDKGCYVSESPIFVIPPSHTWIILLMTTIVFISISVFLLTMLYQRLRMYRDFFKQVKSPTVLLVYHPESQTVMNFVTTLAEFLKTTCCVKNLMADNCVGNKNPTKWIKTQIDEADRILFIIPMDCEAESCTPLRNQWKVALDHCTGYMYTTGSDHYKRLAILMLPDSGEVPWQLKDIQQFDLTHHPAALANWLHGGVFLDQFFLWRPRIHAHKKLRPNWADVRSVSEKITSASTKQSNESSLLPLEIVAVMSNSTVGREELDNSNSEDDDHEESSIAAVMDPDIPGFEMLSISSEGSNESLDNLVVVEDGIFT